MTDIIGQFWPQVIRSGQKATIRIEKLPNSARQVSAVVFGADSVETTWRMTQPLELGGGGTGYATVEVPQQPRETAMFIHSVVVDEATITLPVVSFSICDPVEPVGRSDDEVIDRYRELLRQQEERYSAPIGDPSFPGAVKYRVACIVQDLLLTTPLKLPGVRALGLDTRPDGADASQLAVALTEQLGWGIRPAEPAWSEAFKREHPVSVFVYDNVFAESVGDAFETCAAARDDLLAVLAVNRGAAGSPVVTCLEQIEDGKTVASKFRFEHPNYSGNLAGGFIAGENQGQLLIHHAALSHDSLLKLCVGLYREALADPSPDAKYFRFWSVLETLAISRVQPGLPVTRLDGSVWPNNLDSSNAAPRVYQMVADILFRGAVRKDESSAVDPAGDLEAAVTHWYARRNATAHYGKFVIGDPAQARRNWYARALATWSPQGLPDDWLRAFESICTQVLQAEMLRVGEPLVQ